MPVKIPFEHKKSILDQLQKIGWEIKKNVAKVRIGRDVAKLYVTDVQSDNKATLSFRSDGHGEVTIDATLVGELEEDMNTLKRVLGNLVILAIEEYTDTTKKRVTDFVKMALK